MRSSPALHRAHRIVAGLFAALVLVLAVLAGRYVSLGDQIIEVHGYIGNGVFLLALVNLGLAVALRPDDGPALAVAGLIALLTFAQVGLGYVGRDTADAAALHIPTGVLLMGLSAYQFADLRNRIAPHDRSA